MRHSKNSTRASQTGASDLEKIMQCVLDKAKQLGATDAVVTVDHDEGYSVDVRMRDVETIAFNEDKGVSVNVYFGHQKGQASSTDTSEKAIEAMVNAACDIAKVSAADPCFGLPDKDLITSDFPDLELHHPWSITPPEAIEMALKCEALALDHDARITNSEGVNFSTYNFTHGFANTAGGLGIVHGSRHSISCSLIAEDNGLMQRDYDYTTSRNPTDLVSIDVLAKRAAERAVSRLNARKIKTQRAPVIFSARVASGILSSFISAINGGNVYRKNTFLLNALDTPIFPKGFKLYEQPHIIQGLGSAPFDGEGILTRNNVLVDDGYLRQYVLGSYSARRMGLKTTANSGGVHNLTLDAPEHSVDDLSDLIRTMQTGLLVTELMGQGVNGLTGDYSRGASGFWVENSQIQFPVEGITIASNLKDMFLAIEGVANDINVNIATRCGSLLIKQMMVAGE